MKKEIKLNGSHTHCWNQGKSLACGIPLEKHKQCCLCDMKIVEMNTIPPVKENKNLEYCATCIQMTNHIEGTCLKCGKSKENKSQFACLCKDNRVKGQSACTRCSELYGPLTPSIEAIIEEFENNFIQGGQIKPNDVNGPAEYDSWLSTDPDEVVSFLRNHLASFGAAEYQRGLSEAYRQAVKDNYQRGLEEGKLMK